MERPVHVSLVVAGEVVARATWREGQAPAAAWGEGAWALLDDAVGADLRRRRPARAREARCPECGCTPALYHKDGRLGCPRCYRAFGKLLKRELRKLHRGTEHLGKTPRGRLDAAALERRRAALDARLAEAIREERYEDAALLRDELALLARVE